MAVSGLWRLARFPTGHLHYTAADLLSLLSKPSRPSITAECHRRALKLGAIAGHYVMGTQGAFGYRSPASDSFHLRGSRNQVRERATEAEGYSLLTLPQYCCTASSGPQPNGERRLAQLHTTISSHPIRRD